MQWLPHQTPLAIAFSNYDDFLYYSPKYFLLKKADEWISEKNHIYWNIFSKCTFLRLVAKNELDSNAKSHQVRKQKKVLVCDFQKRFFSFFKINRFHLIRILSYRRIKDKKFDRLHQGVEIKIRIRSFTSKLNNKVSVSLDFSSFEPPNVHLKVMASVWFIWKVGIIYRNNVIKRNETRQMWKPKWPPNYPSTWCYPTFKSIKTCKIFSIKIEPIFVEFGKNLRLSYRQKWGSERPLGGWCEKFSCSLVTA